MECRRDPGRRGNHDSETENTRRILHRRWGQNIGQLFAQWDTDGDGALSYEEFHAAIKRLVSGITDMEFLQLVKIVDENGDGDIELSELENFCNSYKRATYKMQKERLDRERAEKEEEKRRERSWRGRASGARSRRRTQRVVGQLFPTMNWSASSKRLSQRHMVLEE